eukprot:1416087-Rhodomonas_salina.1
MPKTPNRNAPDPGRSSPIIDLQPSEPGRQQLCAPPPHAATTSPDNTRQPRTHAAARERKDAGEDGWQWCMRLCVFRLLHFGALLFEGRAMEECLDSADGLIEG